MILWSFCLLWVGDWLVCVCGDIFRGVAFTISADAASLRQCKVHTYILCTYIYTNLNLYICIYACVNLCDNLYN